MDRDAVVFKGTKEGLMILLKDGLPFETLKASLIERLESGRSFFEGSRTQLRVSGNLSDAQAEEITRLMRDSYGLFEVEVENRPSMSARMSAGLASIARLEDRSEPRSRDEAHMRRYRQREWEREKEQQKQLARERLEREKERERALEIERERGRALEREREREREREIAREHPRDRDPIRERERENVRDREPQRDRDREPPHRERDPRDRQRDREPPRERETERSLIRDAYEPRRGHDREREPESMDVRPPDVRPLLDKGDVWSRPERETMALFVHHTVRSGQRISYPGDVVVVGDVNPGAELVAGGNIIVMGQMRGMAHAGALGEERAVVAAFVLQPMQLRIAGIIGRSPDDGSRPTYPEQARVENGAIIIEPYGSVKR